MNGEKQQAKTAYISLGSNMGDREQTLRKAIIQLHQSPMIDVIGCSSMYETDPVGYLEQSAFINMTIAIKTTHLPQALLDAMLAVEHDLGRIRHFQNGPRTIDLDLLLYEGVAMQTVQLTLPHPRMLERCFVLIPLVELMKALRAKELKRMLQYVQKCEGKEGVALWKELDWQGELGRFVN